MQEQSAIGCTSNADAGVCWVPTERGKQHSGNRPIESSSNPRVEGFQTRGHLMIVCRIRPQLFTLFYPGFITPGTFSCDALGKAHLKTSRTWSSVDLASASSALGVDIEPRKTVPVVPAFVPASPRRDQRSERRRQIRTRRNFSSFGGWVPPRK